MCNECFFLGHNAVKQNLSDEVRNIHGGTKQHAQHLARNRNIRRVPKARRILHDNALCANFAPENDFKDSSNGLKDNLNSLKEIFRHLYTFCINKYISAIFY